MEIEVTINGAHSLLGFETTLRNALPEMRPPGCRNDLRIKREFLGKPTEVNFDSTNGSILDLVLVGGDRISCSGN